MCMQGASFAYTNKYLNRMGSFGDILIRRSRKRIDPSTEYCETFCWATFADHLQGIDFPMPVDIPDIQSSPTRRNASRYT
jgi:hypothetical protein